jgi:hypothetical protein
LGKKEQGEEEMKYFRREEYGEPEELTWDNFIKGIQGEFRFGENYYEHAFVLFGLGHKLIGSRHMYWVDPNDDLKKGD